MPPVYEVAVPQCTATAAVVNSGNGGAPTPPAETDVVQSPAIDRPPECETRTTEPPAEYHCRGGLVYKQEPLVVTKSRVVRNKKCYARTVIAEIKARLGTPDNTAANKLVVRRMAHDIMSRHGVRPTHMNQLMPVICVMVFYRNDDELRADELESYAQTSYRRKDFGWFRAQLYRLCGYKVTRRWF